MHRIGYMLPEGFQVMALATQAVFELANLMVEKPFYEVETYAMSGTVRASAGLALQAKPFTAHSRADTWLVAGNLTQGTSLRHRN
jgi:exopolyphosphatase/pppGpp-phosphohydrolase